MATAFRRTAVLAIFLGCMLKLAAAEGEPPASRDTKAFEAVVAFSQNLSGWALLIAGGSIVTLVGTSYHRPQRWWARLMYLLFVPGWYFLGRCMYFGVEVQRASLGYLFSSAVGQNLVPFKSAVNDDALGQILGIQHAVYCFAGWLVLYLIWWLSNCDVQQASGGQP